MNKNTMCMKYLKLFEDFEPHDPYELMIIPPNKKAEMIIRECGKSNPNLNLVSDLIVLGANVDWQDEDNDGWAPLHGAARDGRVEIVRMLIDAGANVNVQTNYGKTPLHWAAWNGRVEVVRMLIGAGADVNLKDNDGWTPLHVAAGYGRVEIARMLIDAKADLNVQDNSEQTPLHRAADNGRVDIARMLIAAGARKDISNIAGKFPYDLTNNYELKNLLRP